MAVMAKIAKVMDFRRKVAVDAHNTIAAMNKDGGEGPFAEKMAREFGLSEAEIVLARAGYKAKGVGLAKRD